VATYTITPQRVSWTSPDYGEQHATEYIIAKDGYPIITLAEDTLTDAVDTVTKLADQGDRLKVDITF
jgi:hypothetical protein